MKQVTINLDDEVYSFLQLRAAIDDDRIEAGIERFLTELVSARKEKRPVNIVATRF